MDPPLLQLAPRKARSARVAGLAAMLAIASTAAAAPPEGYPSSYNATLSAARDEGRVVVYSTTDLSAVAALIRDFESSNPGIKVEYNDLNSTELHNRFLSETAARRPSADVLWSSAMDLQMKLANDNFAARYKSPEATSLPEWAIWRDEAFGTTFEPAVFVYSTRFVGARGGAPYPCRVPAPDHDPAGEVRGQRHHLRHREVGRRLSVRDAGQPLAAGLLGPRAGHWVREAVELETSTSVMVQRIAAGKDYLGYNLIGSYALTRARRDPSIGVVLPSDYTLVMSRIAMHFQDRAPSRTPLGLWLDYLLSKRGQTMLVHALRVVLDPQRRRRRIHRRDAAREAGSGAEGDRRRARRCWCSSISSKQAEFLRRWNQDTQFVK